MDGGLGVNAIANTAEALRKELLGSRKAAGVPAGLRKAGDTALVEGKIVDKKAPDKAVQIADAMRHGGLDRIEREAKTISRPTRNMRGTRIQRSSPK